MKACPGACWIGASDLLKEAEEHRLCDRFRGFLPVVIDVETGGFIARTDAILEIAATTVPKFSAGA